MFAAFNAQCTRLALSAERHFDLYAIEARGATPDAQSGFRLLASQPVPDGVLALALLGETPLVATVGIAAEGTSRRVTLWDLEAREALVAVDCPAAPVSGVQMSPRQLLVTGGPSGCQGWLFSLPELTLLCSIAPPPAEAPALTAYVSAAAGAEAQRARPVLSPCCQGMAAAAALPEPGVPEGAVRLMFGSRDARRLPGDNTPLNALAFSRDGTLLAAASDGGTGIRILSVPSGFVNHVYRRGRQAAVVGGIGFSPAKDYLGLTSSHGTLHVFRYKGRETEQATSCVRIALVPPEAEEPAGVAGGGDDGGSTGSVLFAARGGGVAAALLGGARDTAAAAVAADDEAAEALAAGATAGLGRPAFGFALPAHEPRPHVVYVVPASSPAAVPRVTVRSMILREASAEAAAWLTAEVGRGITDRATTVAAAGN